MRRSVEYIQERTENAGNRGEAEAMRMEKKGVCEEEDEETGVVNKIGCKEYEIYIRIYVINFLQQRKKQHMKVVYFIIRFTSLCKNFSLTPVFNRSVSMQCASF